MSLVTQGSFVRITFSSLKPARSRIVLDHVIVPIDYPQGAIRSDFRADGSGPFVIARGEASAVVRQETRATRVEVELAKQMARRLGHKLNSIPVFPGKSSRRVKRAAGASGVFSMPIHLSDFRRNGKKLLAVGNRFKPAG